MLEGVQKTIWNYKFYDKVKDKEKKIMKLYYWLSLLTFVKQPTAIHKE